MVGKIRRDDWSRVRYLGKKFGVEIEKGTGKYKYTMKNENGRISHTTFNGLAMYLTQLESGSLSKERLVADLKSGAKMDF